MEDQSLRKNYPSGAGVRGMPRFSLAQARRSHAALRFRMRARGYKHLRAHTRHIPNKLRIASGTSTVTFVTPDHGIWSHTARARRWTIEMTQFVFRQDHAVAASGWMAGAEKGSKTVDQGMNNVLSSEEIERSENGH